MRFQRWQRPDGPHSIDVLVHGALIARLRRMRGWRDGSINKWMRTQEGLCLSTCLA